MGEKKIIAYKGFDENLCCMGFQYEIGKEYETTGKIKCCSNGFHACTNPLDVLEYYDANGNNRFCIVEQSGTIITDDKDTKQASSKIKIKSEIGLGGLSALGAIWIGRNTNPYSIIRAAKGEGSDKSYSYSQINSDRDYDHIGTSGSSDHIFSSGYSAQIASSGDGDKIESIGECSVICCAGDNSMVKAKKGSWITLSEWGYSKEKKRNIPVCVKTEFVDGERIKEDTWYRLINGEFKEQ